MKFKFTAIILLIAAFALPQVSEADIYEPMPFIDIAGAEDEVSNLISEARGLIDAIRNYNNQMYDRVGDQHDTQNYHQEVTEMIARLKLLKHQLAALQARINQVAVDPVTEASGGEYIEDSPFAEMPDVDDFDDVEPEPFKDLKEDIDEAIDALLEAQKSIHP